MVKSDQVRSEGSIPRVPVLPLDEQVTDNLNVEFLFDEPVVVAAGAHTKWARRRKIDLAELIDELWILGGPDTWNSPLTKEIFRARGLSVPEPRVATVSHNPAGPLGGHRSIPRNIFALGVAAAANGKLCRHCAAR